MSPATDPHAGATSCLGRWGAALLRCAGAVIWPGLAVASCATQTAAGPSGVVVACAADGTCPAGTHCAGGLCKPGSPSDATVAAQPDGGGTDGATAGQDAAAGVCEPDPSGGPTARGDIAGGFAGGALLVLYGDEGAPIQCQPNPKLAKDAYLFNPCVGWSAVSGDQPPPRARAASAQDLEGDALWIFGGRFRAGSSGAYTNYADLWRYDGPTKAWSLMADGGGPKARSNAVMAWRKQTKTLYVHGGNTSTSGLTFAPMSDVWTYDVAAATWTQQKTTGGGPSARLFHAGAISDDGKYLVVFSGGGADAFQGPFYTDTWRLDLQTLAWKQLGKGPMGRIKAGMTAVPGSPLLWLFGGHDDGAVGNRNDLWTLDPEGGQWAVVRPGDLGKGDDPDQILKPPPAFCDFPPDFMALDKDSPERREAFIFTADGHSALWLAGGKSDCGNLRDVWRYDLKTGIWAASDDTTTGWSCGRYKSPCQTLCN